MFRKIIILFLFISLIFTITFIFFSLKNENKNFKDEKNMLIVGKKFIYLNYDKELKYKLSVDLNINKEKKISNFIFLNDYSALIENLNTIFPKKIESYKFTSKELENYENIPFLEVDGEKYINSYQLSNVFLEKFYKDSNKIINKKILVDILNANGKNGYASKIGKRIKENLNYEYNTANYEKLSEYSYIINNTLEKNQIENLIFTLPEKYLKLKKDLKIETLADIVFVLGKERVIPMKIYFIKYKSYEKEMLDILKKNGYSNLRRIKSDDKIEETIIEYNEEDYFIAYKIAKILKIDKLVENNELKEKINVYIKY